MTVKPKTIEDRVSDLEREIAVLKAAHAPSDVGESPGFAEEGQPALATDTPGLVDLERRIVDLETTVAQLKSATGQPGPNDWRDAVGWAKDDPEYDEAMRLGAEWRKRENERSIRDLERRGEIDADPGHRSSQRPGSRRPPRKGTAKSS